MGKKQKSVIKSARLRSQLNGTIEPSRSAYIGLKVSPDEKSSMAQAARSVNLCVSSYLRKLHQLAVDGELGGANNES